jgi:Fe-S-cluster containining protein
MAEKDCRRCGQCCTVCTDIQLTHEEVREGLYYKRQRNKPYGNLKGWSKWIIMRGMVYEPQVKRELFACIYWDPVTRDCVIYEDRPLVCQQYKCVDDITGKLHRIWRGINKGKETALCLIA